MFDLDTPTEIILACIIWACVVGIVAWFVANLKRVRLHRVTQRALEMTVPRPRRPRPRGKIYLSDCAPLRAAVIDEYTAGRPTVRNVGIPQDEAKQMVDKARRDAYWNAYADLAEDILKPRADDPNRG